MALMMLRNVLKKRKWRGCFLTLEQAASFINRVRTLLPYYDQRSGQLDEMSDFGDRAWSDQANC